MPIMNEWERAWSWAGDLRPALHPTHHRSGSSPMPPSHRRSGSCPAPPNPATALGSIPLPLPLWVQPLSTPPPHCSMCWGGMAHGCMVGCTATGSSHGAGSTQWLHGMGSGPRVWLRVWVGWCVPWHGEQPQQGEHLLAVATWCEEWLWGVAQSMRGCVAHNCGA